MRVIAGTHRSRLLTAPRGLETRPTGDRLRERLFDILGPRLPGARFADLYAGSGAIGIEALSRGAAWVLFAEQANAPIACIRENLRQLDIARGFHLAATGVAPALRQARERNQARFDLVFLDPPYTETTAYADTLRLLAASRETLLAPNAIVVAEHRSTRRKEQETMSDTYGALARYRLVEQGEAALSFYRIREEPFGNG